MSQKPISASYKVVSGPYAPGETHRDPKLRRWRYLGRALWFRPPRVNRWQFGLAVLLAIMLLQLTVASLADALGAHWSR